MAVSITNERLFQWVNKHGEKYIRMATFRVVYDSSYPTSGEVWDLSNYFSRVFHMSFTPAEDGTPGYLAAANDAGFTSTNSILVELFCQMPSGDINKAFQECTAGRQMQSVVIRALVVGL